MRSESRFGLRLADERGGSGKSFAGITQAVSQGADLHIEILAEGN